jgi:glycosyltransferase involved in cell wall biosynthesis
LKREVLDGVEVVRTVIYPTQHLSFGRRMASYLSFAASAASLGPFLLPRVEYLIVESPPLFLGATGVWLKLLKRARLVFNVSDLWPETAVVLGRLRPGSPAHRASEWLERFCYRQAWLITGQSREIVRDIASRFPSKRIFHLSNGVESHMFHPNLGGVGMRERLGPADACLALYAGLHGLAQGLEHVLEAADSLPSDSRLVMTFVGDGPDKAKLIDRARKNSSSRMRFLDPVPHAEMPSVLASADIVVVPLVSHIPGAVPSKLYEAMASGKPVVLMAEGEAASLVRECRAGLVVPPCDEEALRKALTQLEHDPELRRTLGANGRVAAVERFDRTRISEEFVSFLEQQSLESQS